MFDLKVTAVFDKHVFQIIPNILYMGAIAHAAVVVSVVICVFCDVGKEKLANVCAVES